MRDVMRRVVAGAAFAGAITLGGIGVAHAQTDSDTDTDGGGVTSTTPTSAVVVNTSAGTGSGSGSGTGGRLADTGDDWVLPATIAGAGVLLALGTRQVARTRALG